MSNRVFVVFVSLVFLIGLTTGYRLSGLPRLENYKLVNIVGLFYDFLGVVVLSEIAASSPKWKKISVAWVAPTVLWLHTILPLGAFIGALISGIVVHGASSSALSRFTIAFWGYSIIPLAALNDMVVFPQFAALKSNESRWRCFALLLLLTGVGLQLIAALMGLRVPPS